MGCTEKTPTVIISPSTPDDDLDVLVHILKPHNDDNGNDFSSEDHKCNRKCIHRYPIHHACRAGNYHELRSLLEAGDHSPLELDCNRRTPLHYAAATGNCEKGLKCVQVLLECPTIIPPTKDGNKKYMMIKKYLNSVDKHGETALHIAAQNESLAIVVLLLVHWADINMISDSEMTQLCLIYSHCPSALCLLMKRSISFVSNCYCKKEDEKLNLDYKNGNFDYFRNSFSYDLCLNFAPVIGFMNDDGKVSYPETEFLFEINNKKRAKAQRKDVLKNCLAQTFLHLKWQKLKWFCYSAILFHLLWLTLYIGLAIDIFTVNCPYTFPSGPKLLNNIFESTECKMSTSSQTGMMILTIMSILITLKEMSQIHRLGTLYLTFENFGQIILLALIFQTIPQVFLESAVTPLNYQLSAFGIFLAWDLMLCQLSKIPRIDKRIKIFHHSMQIRLPNHGVYIEILNKVFKNVLVFIIIFSPLLLGFGFSFRILLPAQKEFSSPLRNIMKLTVMMTGELEYDDVFHNEDKSAVLIFEAASHIFYLVFVVLATMILFNLLIGFTVSDIQGLQNDAAISQVSNKLEQMYLMESFLLSKKMQILFEFLRKLTGIHFGSVKVVHRPANDIYNSSYTCLHTSLFDLPEDLRSIVRGYASFNTMALSDKTENFVSPLEDRTAIEQKFKVVFGDMFSNAFSNNV